MIIERIILGAIAGSPTVANHRLEYVRPLKVKVNGLGYDILKLPTNPGNRQVRYIPGLGSLFFGASFFFPPNSKVYVLYKK